jgi:hypothetical protein
LAVVSYTTHGSSWSHQGSSNALRVWTFSHHQKTVGKLSGAVLACFGAFSPRLSTPGRVTPSINAMCSSMLFGSGVSKAT